MSCMYSGAVCNTAVVLQANEGNINSEDNVTIVIRVLILLAASSSTLNCKLAGFVREFVESLRL